MKSIYVVRQRSYETANDANYGFKVVVLCNVRIHPLGPSFKQDSSSCKPRNCVWGRKKYIMSSNCKSTDPNSVTLIGPAPPPCLFQLVSPAPPLTSASLALLLCRSLLHILLFSLHTLINWVADFLTIFSTDIDYLINCTTSSINSSSSGRYCFSSSNVIWQKSKIIILCK